MRVRGRCTEAYAGGIRCAKGDDMCRWLAYTGEPIRPSALILDTQHSVVAMSLNSPLGAETVNGDGFGLGWYPEDAAGAPHPAAFHSIEPAWNDQNLREISRAVM